MLLWTNLAVGCENFVYRTMILSLGTIRAKKNWQTRYERYNTFFHAPKNNEGESNLRLITWFPHRRPLYCWMCLIKRFFLVTGLVKLKLTQPIIPAKNPNSSKFNGTEGVSINILPTTYVCHKLRNTYKKSYPLRVRRYGTKNSCLWTGPHVSTCKQNIHIANCC